jgi:hypothetical protein
LFKEEVPTIKFKSHIGDYSIGAPVVTAGKIKADWMNRQPANKKFTSCPGMLDYSSAGYIITAHCDFEIKANKSGVVVKVGEGIVPLNIESRFKTQTFDHALVDGWANIEGVKKSSLKIYLPWYIETKPGYSAYVLPALMHSDFLDKIFIYPGVVDFDKYHGINMVFSVIKECEFVIPVGTPILHVIPFKREEMTAVCGKATDHETDRAAFNFLSRINHYYTRYLHSKKSYKMTCPYEHRE